MMKNSFNLFSFNIFSWMALVFLICLLVGLATSGCQKMDIAKLLGPGVKCKAAITTPMGRPGEVVIVDVDIYDCVERPLPPSHD